MNLEHELPANSLINGVYYTATVRVTGSDGKVSSYSEPIIFRCLADPTWRFIDFAPNIIVKNSTYAVSLEYSQGQGDLLNAYHIKLYDISLNEVFVSDKIYNTSVLSHTLFGLVDKAQYYIKAAGESVGGLTFETDLIPFSVAYTTPFSTSLVGLENVPFGGCVVVTSNITSVSSSTSIPSPAFINDAEVDLTNNRWVMFDHGQAVNGDFSVLIRCKKLKTLTPFFELIGKDGDIIRLSYIEKRIYQTVDDIKTYKDVGFIKAESFGGKDILVETKYFNLLTASQYIKISLSRINYNILLEVDGVIWQ